MSWLSSSLGLQARRAGGGAQSRGAAHREIESIRAAMLRLLDADSAKPGAASALIHRVRYASSAEGLWYLRSEIMSVLASSRGEAAARALLADISVLFHEVLPEGLASPLRASRAHAGVR